VDSDQQVLNKELSLFRFEGSGFRVETSFSPRFDRTSNAPFSSPLSLSLSLCGPSGHEPEGAEGGGVETSFSPRFVAREMAVFPFSAAWPERELFIDKLLVRIHFIIVMIRWTGLAPWEFESTFPSDLTSTFLDPGHTPHGKGIS